MILNNLFKDSSKHKEKEKYFLDLLTKANIQSPIDTNIETTIKWHKTNKEILVNSIVKPFFEFALKYMHLLRENSDFKYDNGTKSYWEKEYIIENGNQEKTLNYCKIQLELDKMIIPIIFSLLSQSSNWSENTKKKYDELETDYKQIEAILNKNIPNFEDTSYCKKSLINFLFTTTLTFYNLKPEIELSLNTKSESWDENKKNEIKSILKTLKDKTFDNLLSYVHYLEKEIENFKNLSSDTASPKIKHPSDERIKQEIKYRKSYLSKSCFLENNYNLLIENYNIPLFNQYIELRGKNNIKALLSIANLKQNKFLLTKKNNHTKNYQQWKYKYKQTYLKIKVLASFSQFKNKYHSKFIKLTDNHLTIIKNLKKLLNDFSNTKEITIQQVKDWNQQEINTTKQQISKWKAFFYKITFKFAFKESVGKKYEYLKQLENKNFEKDIEKYNLDLAAENKKENNLQEKPKLKKKISFNDEVKVKIINCEPEYMHRLNLNTLFLLNL